MTKRKINSKQTEHKIFKLVKLFVMILRVGTCYFTFVITGTKYNTNNNLRETFISTWKAASTDCLGPSVFGKELNASVQFIFHISNVSTSLAK